MSKQKKTSKDLSNQTKLQLLADVDKKQGTKKEIEEKYGISHNTLSTLVKNRAKLEIPGLAAEFQPDRTRQKTTEKLDIDQALFVWFKQARAVSASISTLCSPVRLLKAYNSWAKLLFKYWVRRHLPIFQIKGSNRSFYKPSVFAPLYEQKKNLALWNILQKLSLLIKYRFLLYRLSPTSTSSLRNL